MDRNRIGVPATAALLVAILAVGFVIRLVHVQDVGYPGDMDIFASWLRAAFTATPGTLYTKAPDFGYPPASGTIFLLVASLVRHAGGTFASMATVREGVKLPAILCDAICAVIAFDIARRLSNRISGLWSAAAITFNPASIYISAFWGQIDAIPAAFALAAVHQVLFGTAIVAWPLLAFAALVKPQVVFLVPLFAISALGPRDVALDRRRVVAHAVGLVLAGVLCEGFALAFFPHRGPIGSAVAMVKLIRSQSSLFGYTSLNAFNLWALFSDFFASDGTKFLFIKLHVWGTLLFAGFAVATYARYAALRTSKSLIEASVLVLFALFCFYTQMHERYVYFTLPFLALLVFDRRYAIGFVILAFTTMVNLEYAYIALTLSDAKVTVINTNELAPLLVHVCSLANLGLFLWMFVGFLGVRWEDLMPARSLRGDVQSSRS